MTDNAKYKPVKMTPKELENLYGRHYYEGQNSGYPENGYHTAHPDWGAWIAIIQKLRPSGTLLDLGCAYGFLIEEARRKGYQAFGLDISFFALTQAPEKFRLNVQADAERLPLTQKCVDIVTAFDVLEHLLDPENCIREIRRVLRPDGILVGATPDPIFFEGDEETHFSERPPSFWAQLLEKHGFETTFRFSEVPYNFQFVATAAEIRQKKRVHSFKHDFIGLQKDFITRQEKKVEVVPRFGWGPLEQNSRRLEKFPASIYLLNRDLKPKKLGFKLRLIHSGQSSTLRIRLDSQVIDEIHLNPDQTDLRFHWDHIPIPIGGHHLFFELYPEIKGISIADIKISAQELNSDELVLSLPFDLFQRYRLVKEVCEVLPQSSILDIGGYIGDASGHLATSQDFLVGKPENLCVSTDLRHCDLPSHIPANAWNQPFQDGAFDLVVSLDVLEHIPRRNRPEFLEECFRVAKDYILIGAPFDSPAVRKAEKELREGVMKGHRFLEEHQEMGLPDPRFMKQFAEDHDCQILSLASSFLPRWKEVQVLSQHLFSLHDASIIREFNSLYNQHFFREDQREPGYRTLYIISKKPLTRSQVNRISKLNPSSSQADQTRNDLVSDPRFQSLFSRAFDTIQKKSSALTDAQFLTNSRQELARLLRQEKETLASDNRSLLGERRTLLKDVEKLLRQQKILIEEREKILNEKQLIIDEREKVLKEKSALLADRNAVRESNKLLAAERDALLQTQETLLKERASFITERKAIDEDRTQLKSDRDRLAAERDNLERERTALVADRDRLEKERARLETDRNSYRSENQSLRRERERFVEERQTLISEGQALRRERHTLAGERETLAKEVRKLSEDRERIRNGLEKQRSENQKLYSEVEALRTARKDLLQDREKLFANISELESRKDTIQSRLNEILAENEQVRSQLGHLTKERETLIQERSALDQDRNLLREDRDALRRETNRLDARLKYTPIYKLALQRWFGRPEPVPVVEGPPPRVTAYIINYNGRAFLEELLNSLEAQTFSDFEVRLIDNGSSDDSVEYVEKSYPRVKIMAMNENLGFARAGNLGIRSCLSPYVIFLNADLKLDRRWMEKMVAAADSDPAVAAVAPKMLLYDQPHLINGVGGAMNYLGYTWDRGMLEEDQGQYDEPAEVIFAPAAAALFRRESFIHVGMFDERYFMYHEDVDLGWRLWIAGYRILTAPEAIVYHHFGGTTKESKGMNWRELIGERNNIRALIKNYGIKKVFTTIKDLALLPQPGRRKLGQIRNLLWNLLFLPETYMLRRRIQRKRIRPDSDLERLIVQSKDVLVRI